jgi:hypothetical protein
MFVKKFPNNSVIKKIKINGGFISVYVPKSRVVSKEQFTEKKLWNNKNGYLILNIGQGAMHTYAHGKGNKELSFLFKQTKMEKEELDHYHFQLPSFANPANVKKFLEFLDDGDLPQDQKEDFLEEYRTYTFMPSADRLLELINPYAEAISAAAVRGDSYLPRRMPLYDAFIKEHIRAVEKNNSFLFFGDEVALSQESKKEILNLGAHNKLLIRIKDNLELWQKGKLDKSIFIANLNQIFEQASTTTRPNFAQWPHLYNELINNFPYMDEGLNDLYTLMRHQLSVILNTDELKYEQPTPNNCKLYNKAINCLSGHGAVGKTIMDSMIRLKQGDESWLNPYWINSGVKLKAIIGAVLNIDEQETLEELMADKNSDLYKAVNMSRLLPITFLGTKPSYDKAKTAMYIEASILEVQQEQLLII